MARPGSSAPLPARTPTACPRRRSAASRSISATRRWSCRTAVRLSIVDVPGHERFVRNMVAGATGIDLFLLVVDAAEGARPQTHEHLAILRLLGIGHGVVAITKADSVDEETLALALEEGRELVPGAPVVATSARTGAGLDELVAALAAVAGAADSSAQHAHAGLPTRLFVDRSFSLRGIGTVVTGTLWSGSVGEGDELLAEPTRTRVRVRSVQVHDRPVERAEAGQRVAARPARARSHEAPPRRRAGRARRLPDQLPPRRPARRARRARRPRPRACPSRHRRPLRPARPRRRALRAAPARDPGDRRTWRSLRPPRPHDRRRRASSSTRRRRGGRAPNAWSCSSAAIRRRSSARR